MHHSHIAESSSFAPVSAQVQDQEMRTIAHLDDIGSPMALVAVMHATSQSVHDLIDFHWSESAAANDNNYHQNTSTNVMAA